MQPFKELLDEYLVMNLWEHLVWNPASLQLMQYGSCLHDSYQSITQPHITWQSGNRRIDNTCCVVCYALAQRMKDYTPLSMTDKTLGFTNPPQSHLWFLWVKWMENVRIGENSRVSRCSRALSQRARGKKVCSGHIYREDCGSLFF